MFGCLPLDALRHLPSARSIASGLDTSHRGSGCWHVSRLATRSTHRLRLLLSSKLVLTTHFPFRFNTPRAPTSTPRHGNDRLLLGLKGSLNEYELDLLRQRSLSARYEKARKNLAAAAASGP